MNAPSALPVLFYNDRTTRGRLRLTGRDRQSFLQGMVTNDVASLTAGDGVYAFLLDATGHTLADARILCLDNQLMLDVEPGTAEFVAATLDKYLVMEKCRIADVSDEFAQVLVGGIGAPALLQSLFALPDADAWRECLNASFDDGLAAAVHLLPVPAFDLYVPAAARDALIAQLESAGAVRASDDAIETARIEAGVPRMGADMDARTLAPETGQESRAIHRRKGCYIGQEVVARIDARGHANRTFVGFFVSGNEPPTPGTTVTVEEREVGRITSSTISPTLSGVPIALGYARNEFAVPGTEVRIGGVTATVSALPFGGAA